MRGFSTEASSRLALIATLIVSIAVSGGTRRPRGGSEDERFSEAKAIAAIDRLGGKGSDQTRRAANSWTSSSTSATTSGRTMTSAA